MNAPVRPEPVQPVPPVPVRWALLHQHWADVVFLHWKVDPDVVAPLLPPGTTPDLHDGGTWVGLIHFRMRRLGFGPLPGIPWLGSFAETNIRLYSVDAEGRRGVVFRSLDADRFLPVLAARGVAALPYNWAPSRVDGRVAEGEEIEYRTVRRFPGPRGAFSRTRVRTGAAIAEPDPLSHFLTARWALHTRRPLGTVRWPNDHPRWDLHAAELLDLEQDVAAAAGVPGIDGPPDSVLSSPGLPVRFGPWHRLRGQRRGRNPSETIST
ncbi:MAG: DUF2071 domain-containing protein [Pseudonocardia sediminis]